MATYRETSQAILKDSIVSAELNKTGLNYESQVEFITRILSINRTVSTSIRNQSYQNLPSSYVIVDLETTGFTNYDEIIQFAAIKVRNNKIIDTFDSFVHPKDNLISKEITYLTGIDNSIVTSAPTIDELVPKILSFINGYSIVGHNVSFDLRFLKNAGVETGNYTIFDTLKLARYKNLPVDNYKLPTLKDYFNISNKSHNAMNDCETTNILFQSLKNDIKPEKHNENKEIRSDCFNGMKFVITGSFKDIDRSKIKEIILNCGGKVQTTVGKSTNVLIEGIQTSAILKDGVHSSKHLKYISLKQDGYDIDYWNESKLLDILKEENVYG